MEVAGKSVLTKAHVGMVLRRRPGTCRKMRQLFEVPPVGKVEVEPKQGDNGFCGSAMSLFMKVTTSFAPSAK
jgi:hypothetical protein